MYLQGLKIDFCFLKQSVCAESPRHLGMYPQSRTCNPGRVWYPLQLSSPVDLVGNFPVGSQKAVETENNSTTTSYSCLEDLVAFKDLPECWGSSAPGEGEEPLLAGR